MEDVGIFYVSTCGHLVYFTLICSCIFPVFVCCTKRNLATLVIGGNNIRAACADRSPKVSAHCAKQR
jgi:hypothetical protein